MLDLRTGGYLSHTSRRKVLSPWLASASFSNESVSQQSGRGGSWTEQLTVDTAGGSLALIIYAVYPLQPFPTFPSSTVEVKVFEDRITSLYTGGRTYEIVDSPLNRSPLGPAVVMLTCGGRYFVIIVAIRRRSRAGPRNEPPPPRCTRSRPGREGDGCADWLELATLLAGLGFRCSSP
jgi:hypothetical protein